MELDLENMSPDEMKKQIENMQNRLDFFQTVFDTIPFNVFVKDTECRYIFSNKFSDEINKVERGGLYGKTDFDLWPSKELAAEYFNNDQELMKTRESYRGLIPTMDNAEVNYQEIFKTTIIGNDNSISGILGIIIPPDKNIIKTNFVKENLSENENSIIADYMIKTSKLTVLRSIEGFSKVFKYDDNVASLDRTRFHPDDIPIVFKAFEEILNNEFPNRILVRIMDDNNVFHLCNVRLTFFLDKDNKTPLRVSINTKIIPNEMAHDEIIKFDVEATEKMLLTLLKESNDLCLYANPKMDYYQIFISNAIYENLNTKGSWHEFLEILYSHLHPNDYDILNNILISLNKEKMDGALKKEFRFADKDGLYRWKSYRVNRIFLSNGGFLLSFIDINESVLQREQQQIKKLNNDLIDILGTVVEFRDMESGEHIFRIKSITKILLEQLNLIFGETYTEEEVQIISAASALHDIGKIAIPDSILTKPGRLTAEEFEIMKLHSVKGCEILNSIPKIQNEVYYKYSYEICRHHHERYDGRGYPDKLKGDEIPLESQIVSIADVFDALTSKRCYKDAFSIEKATSMILNGECGAFSPKLLQCFLHAKDKIAKLYVSDSNM